MQVLTNIFRNVLTARTSKLEGGRECGDGIDRRRFLRTVAATLLVPTISDISFGDEPRKSQESYHV